MEGFRSATAIAILIATLGGATGCSNKDNELRNRVEALETATLTQIVDNYQPDSKAAQFIREELQRRGVQKPTDRQQIAEQTSPRLPETGNAQQSASSHAYSKTDKLYRIVDKEESNYRAPNGQQFLLRDYYISLTSINVTEGQMHSIAKEIVALDKEVNALLVYFFWPGTEKAKTYTAAMATYAPNGRWEDFQKEDPKQLVIKYGRAEVELASQNRSEFGFKPATSSRKQKYENSPSSSYSSPSSRTIRTSGDTVGAWVGMTYFVKDRLKCPSSAKFEYAGAQNVIPLDNDRYRIRSYVDAQNSFGAPIRMHFEGVVRRTATSWALVELTIE